MDTSTPAEVLTEYLCARPSLPADEVRVVLAEIWPRLHAPLRHHDTSDLVALFRRVGYVTDDAPAPPTDLVIYRGEPADLGDPGVAWSADQTVAVDYARRYSTLGPAHVLRATAPPTAVLARFVDENEVVVQPDLLKDVINIGGFPHFALPNLVPALRFAASG
jgi:hypothetical protein